MPKTAKTVLVMAGGTGGHIFPALAVANDLIARGHHVEWLGAKGKMEERLVPEHGLTLHTVSMAGVRGKGVKGLLTMPFKLFSAVMQSLLILRRVKPDAVIGFGGFASAPGGLAARLLGKPLIVHEQNAVAGMTNKLLSRFAKHTLLGFSGALAGGKTVGNPVRKDIVARAKTDASDVASDKAIHVLVVGGSLGAMKLNAQLPGVFAALAEKHDIRVHHQTGKNRKDAVVADYAKRQFSAVQVDEFITDMAAAYDWADVVICRSGALTVAEVAVIGLPAVFVPFPFAVDDHQTRNAQHLVDAGGAVLIQERDFAEDTAPLIRTIEPLLNRETLNTMRQAQHSIGQTWQNATADVADICERTMGLTPSATNRITGEQQL